MKVVKEVREGVKATTIESSLTTLDEALSCLSFLDGLNRSSVVYINDEDNTMLVGGGANNFVVSLSLNGDETLLTLVDPQKPEDSFEKVVAGGQLGEYPKNQILSRNLVSQALTFFFLNNKPDPALTWTAE